MPKPGETCIKCGTTVRTVTHDLSTPDGRREEVDSLVCDCGVEGPRTRSDDAGN